MTNEEIIEITRFQLDDTIIPYRWTDEELIHYLNNAQNEACRRAHLLISYPSAISIVGTNNISFIASTKKISKATGGFLSAGGVSEVNTFEKDDQITISGTTNNNGIKTISDVSDTEITVVESLVNESNVSATIEATRTTTRIPIKANVHTYKLHPKILMVNRAKMDSLTYPLVQKTIWDLDAATSIIYYNWFWEDVISLWETVNNSLCNYIEDNGSIRLIGIPQTDDVLWMIISRLPKRRFTVSDLQRSPEIPEIYHSDLVDWICYQAYMKQDAETVDLSKAQIFEKNFERKFGIRPSAQTEMNRKRLSPNSKARQRQFGF